MDLLENTDSWQVIGGWCASDFLLDDSRQGGGASDLDHAGGHELELVHAGGVDLVSDLQALPSSGCGSVWLVPIR